MREIRSLLLVIDSR